MRNYTVRAQLYRGSSKGNVYGHFILDPPMPSLDMNKPQLKKTLVFTKLGQKMKTITVSISISMFVKLTNYFHLCRFDSLELMQLSSKSKIGLSSTS